MCLMCPNEFLLEIWNATQAAICGGHLKLFPNSRGLSGGHVSVFILYYWYKRHGEKIIIWEK